MINGLVSIIVPVYNVGQYLSKCVESILCQEDFENYEILLVDDGSQDRSGEMCDEYARIYPDKIRVFHKKNGGLSDARNYGIGRANGEWLFFIDSDDYLRKDALSKLYSRIDAGVDIVIGQFKRVDENGVPCGDANWVRPTEIACYSGQEAAEKMYGKLGRCVTAWGKLYRRLLFDDVRYPVGILHEDEAVQFPLFIRARKIIILPDILYFYVQREGSIMSKKTFQRLLDYVSAVEFRLDDAIKMGNYATADMHLPYLAGWIIRRYYEASSKEERKALKPHYRTYNRLYDEWKKGKTSKTRIVCWGLRYFRRPFMPAFYLKYIRPYESAEKNG
jgi:glycosyltransferase involved in cell wall biosynthesis